MHKEREKILQWNIIPFTFIHPAGTSLKLSGLMSPIQKALLLNLCLQIALIFPFGMKSPSVYLHSPMSKGFPQIDMH